MRSAPEEARSLEGEHNEDVRKKPDAQPPMPKKALLAAVAVVVVVLAVIIAVVVVNSDKKAPSDVTKPDTPKTEVTAGKSASMDSGTDSGDNTESGIASYSWAELKSISEEIADAKSDKEGLEVAKSYGLVDSDGRLQGDTKPVTLTVTLTSGTKTSEASVRILGFRHDNLADGGTSGITFEFADVPFFGCYHEMNLNETNSGGWEESDMRSWLNSDFLACLPEDLRDCIEEASKRTNNVGEVSNEGDSSCVTATSDRLWLLSLCEVCGEELTFRSSDGESYTLYSQATYNAEGTQYQLYADSGRTSIDLPIKLFENTTLMFGTHYWLRSPSANSDGFRGILATPDDSSALRSVGRLGDY